MRVNIIRRLSVGSLALLAVLAPTLVATPSSAQAAVPVSIGRVTSVPFTPGKGQGSGNWGYVGDIETVGTGGKTFNYGLGFDPNTQALWVSDSGKVVNSRFSCILAGQSGSPCQVGTPRVFKYDRIDANDSMGDYTANGTYSVDGAGRPGVNDGIGARYQAVADRTVIQTPYQGAAPNILNGPRGLDVASDGTVWVTNSEAQAPVGGVPDMVNRFAADGTQLASAGWTAPWT